MRILMIEDDLNLCTTVSFLLEKEGHTIDLCHDGGDGLQFAMEKAHDIIILDRMLPVMDGLTLLHKIRASEIKTPVLFLTALNTLDDKVSGLDAGADDYLAKPFEIKELLARIRALSRRPVQICLDVVLEFDGISLHPSEKKISKGEIIYNLTKRETDLFELFFKNASQPLTRESIIAHVWGPYAEVEDGNLDNYIYFLRRILKKLESKTQIKTIRSIGYKLEKGV